MPRNVKLSRAKATAAVRFLLSMTGSEQSPLQVAAGQLQILPIAAKGAEAIGSGLGLVSDPR